MYSVFIVDDEIVVREGIRNKINWEETDFTFVGEAPDGELAFSMIQDVKPDILITDIKMPFMDGLELAKMVKKFQPWVHIIILSGHDEFEYAKQAISIGIEDYILKPFTAEELLKSLTKIQKKLDEQKQQYLDIAQLKQRLESNTELMREKFLTDLLIGTISGADALQKASELNLNISARFYCVLLCEIHPDNHNLNNLVSIKSSLLSFSLSTPDVIVFSLSPDILVCILKSNDDTNIEETSFNLANVIEHEATITGNCTVNIAIGSKADRLAHITNSWKNADKALKHYSVFEKNHITSFEDINNDENTETIVTSEEDPLVERIKYAAEGEIETIINQYLETIFKSNEVFSVVASYLVMDVIVAVSKLIEELGSNIKSVIPEILSRSFISNTVRNKESFEREISAVLKKIINWRNTRTQGRYGDAILKAKKYIDENYLNPDICLQSVSEQVCFSPNHFSTVFSQECGTTFIEYLTSVRIEHAKKLLTNTQMRSSDIAYEVGFSDPHYFSFIFKKTTGVSPREYRNQ